MSFILLFHASLTFANAGFSAGVSVGFLLSSVMSHFAAIKGIAANDVAELATKNLIFSY
ncbi:hypothetical protein NQV05_01355 [Mycoplasmopsis agalactiae]|nr:hypothetical protein [Mycoplasmopsis agalactiae]UUM25773.1 hypothetical protein NQV05_01355 [Mycoplasmopsis agalactiae]